MKKHIEKSFYIILLLLLTFTSITVAQDSLRIVTKEDYPQWQHLGQSLISESGNWVAYHISLVQSDDTLYVKEVNNDTTYKYNLASRPRFSKDSKWIAFRIGYPEKELEKMREKKEPIHYKTGFLNLESGERVVYNDASSFTFSESSNYLAVKKYKPKDKKSKGSDLILRNLKTGSHRNIGNVSDFSFNKKGDWIAYIKDAEGKSGNGVELFNLNDNTVHILDSDTASFSQLVWDKEGNALAFFHSFSDTSFEEENHSVVTFRNIYKDIKMEVYNPAERHSFPDSMRIISEFKPIWAEDLSAVFFGIKEWTKKEFPEKKDEKEKKGEKEKDDEEEKKDEKKTKKEKKGEISDKIAGVDIWHWKDKEIQPRQEKIYDTEKNISYLSTWYIDDNRFIQIADENMKYANLTGDQKHAIGRDRKPYQPTLTLPYSDYYIADTRTGKRKFILKKFSNQINSSPDGKFLLYFKDNHWWSYDIKTDRHINLTKDIDTDFWNTRYDGPRDDKPPFGLGGWLKKDKKVLLYDEYNVWSMQPDGSGYEKLTDGDSEKIQFRVIRLDFEEDFLDPEEPLFFRSFGDKTKESGFYKMLFGNKPFKLIYEAKMISRLQKAKKTDRYIFTAQTYRESPNVFLAGKNFNHPKKISDTNPQQKNFLWGKVELIDFINADGKELQGVLHYPVNYESGKKYPMIIYIYERRSQSLHYYIVPSAQNSYNITNYSSQGYFIFQPDIVYTVNQPGMSAVKCVIPAVKKVLETGMIDEKRIGLMGHSWGGYQTAFLVTQTDILAAAVAGAPLIDMVSMYNEIYWNTGHTNQVIFETSQGRFNKPYWEQLNNFLDNSPLFNAENIKTPLLIAFGDEDGAVDWHQGIEMFITMRRLQKPFIMLVYAGENHSNRKKENRLDYAKRANEFFDHYLKGKEAPEWLRGGVSYIDKKKKEEKHKKNKDKK